MRELPAGWKWAKLSEVATINPRPDRGIDDETPVSFVPMPGVSADGPDFLFCTERKFAEVRKGFTHFANGDVLFAKITPCMENGKGAVARNLISGLGFGTTELHVLRPSERLDPNYLYRFMQQQSFRQAAEAAFTGSAGQARVPVEFIRTTEIPLPSIDEQRRIVAKLDEALARVSACRERLDKIPTILARFRQAVLTAACTGQLTAEWRSNHMPRSNTGTFLNDVRRKRRILWESRKANQRTKRKYQEPVSPPSEFGEEIPSEWAVSSVFQIGLLDTGFAFKSADFAEKGIRLLRGENVEPGRLRWKETKFWPKDRASQYDQLRIEEGEIILALDRPLISTGLKIARASSDDLPCLLVQRVMRFKMAEPAITDWLYLNLQLPRFIDHLSSGMTGSDLPHVTGTTVAEYLIGLPSLEEQSEISRRAGRLLTLAERLEAKVAAVRSQLDRISESVLAKAFSGQLVRQTSQGAEMAFSSPTEGG